MERIPLMVPHMPAADRLLPYLRKIDVNRCYTNFGPLNTEFERRIRAVVTPAPDGMAVTTVSNCTAGIELALQSLDLPVGARVLVPAITFVATATAVVRSRLVPVLTDIDSNCWSLTPEIAKSALAETHVDAIVPVAAFGVGQPTDGWDEFVESTVVRVLIDAAGAFGNQVVGRLADVVFSFHATKAFGAAEGGAVLSANSARIEAIRRLANFGIDTSISRLVALGTNAKMSEYHCAIGLASFDMWEETKTARSSLHGRYVARLMALNCGIEFQNRDLGGVYSLLPVLLPPGVQANKVSAELHGKGIDSRRWYCPPLHHHPAFASVQRLPSLAVAEDLGERIIGLPFFVGISERQIDVVCRSLSYAVEQAE